MASGYPDWTRAIRLLGVDGDGNPVTILAAEDGKLYSLIVGRDADDVLRAVRVDNNGQMIMIPRGQSGNYMAIDSEGYMTAVLKGAYGAALRTIGLDDQGRITTYMADDESQWGGVINTGLAELAARLGAPTAWDWRGKVQHIRTFAGGWQDVTSASNGAGAEVALDPTRWLYGGYSAKLVGGSDGTKTAQLKAVFSLTPSNRIGANLAFSVTNEPNYMDFVITAMDRLATYTLSLRYTWADDLLKYLNADSVYTLVGEYHFNNTETVFHNIKAVVDKSTGKIVRVLLNDTQYDIDAAVPSSAAVSTGFRVQLQVIIESNAGENDEIYVDNIGVTIAEP